MFVKLLTAVWASDGVGETVIDPFIGSGAYINGAGLLYNVVDIRRAACDGRRRRRRPGSGRRERKRA